MKGKTLEVNSRLPASEARESLLIHYQFTQEHYRKKFHSGTKTSMESASQYLARLELFLIIGSVYQRSKNPLRD